MVDKISMDQWIALGQLVVAGLMAWSLFQTSKSLNLSRRQFAATIDPSIEVAGCGGKDLSLKITNTGGQVITNLEVYAAATGTFDRHTLQLLTAYMDRPIEPMRWTTVEKGELVRLPINNVFHYRAGAEEKKHQRFVALVLRFERQADSKVFYHLFSGSHSIQPNYISCMPFVLTKGSSIGGGVGLGIKKLRDDIKEYVTGHLDVPHLSG